MDTSLRMVWLGLAFAPYAALAAFDGWLHEKARRVPRVEQILHALAALSLLTFVVLAFSARNMAASFVLPVFLATAFADEFGFHRHLDPRERRVHFASYAALALFVVTWRMQAAGA
jgi:hypothetical protein